MHFEEPLSCTCLPLFHVRSPIDTEPHFSAVKISLHKPLRLPRTFTLYHDSDGAILDHRLHHKWPLQWGRNGMEGSDRGKRPCESQGPPFVNSPGVSHLHSRIGHETPVTHSRNEPP